MKFVMYNSDEILIVKSFYLFRKNIMWTKTCRDLHTSLAAPPNNEKFGEYRGSKHVL